MKVLVDDGVVVVVVVELGADEVAEVGADGDCANDVWWALLGLSLPWLASDDDVSDDDEDEFWVGSGSLPLLLFARSVRDGDGAVASSSSCR